MKIEGVMQDERKIYQLIDQNQSSITANGEIVDQIVPYEEGGEMGNVIWFAGVKNGEVLYRYNSRYVDTISYKPV